MLNLHLHAYGRFDARSSIGPSIWPCFDLLYFHEGVARLQIEPKGVETLNAGEGVLLFPQTRFAGQAESESVLASVQHFSIELAEDATWLPFPLDRLRHKRDGYLLLRGHPREQVDQDIDRAMKLATQGSAPHIGTMRQALLLVILAQLLAKPSPYDENVSAKSSFGDLLRWAQGNFHLGLSVSHLATMAGLSESHFRARFLQELGVSAGKYLRQLRLNEAKRLLRETRDPIKAIAQQLAYSDVVAFHRAFKRQESITPTRYRQRYAPRG